MRAFTLAAVVSSTVSPDQESQSSHSDEKKFQWIGGKE